MEGLILEATVAVVAAIVTTWLSGGEFAAGLFESPKAIGARLE